MKQVPRRKGPGSGQFRAASAALQANRGLLIKGLFQSRGGRGGCEKAVRGSDWEGVNVLYSEWGQWARG